MQMALTKIQEQNRDEIERAIDNIKRSAWDKWFRCEWYRAGARRKWHRRPRGRSSHDDSRSTATKRAVARRWIE